VIATREEIATLTEMSTLAEMSTLMGGSQPRSPKDPSMKKVLSTLRKFWCDEDGPTAVEYAVMLALIIVVCAAAIGAFGSGTNSSFTDSGNKINKSMS